MHYDCMTIDDIKRLPIGMLADTNCALFMWITDPLLKVGFEVLEAWGFCVGTGTRILTEDLRWIKAEDAYVGQKLLAFDEHIPSGKDRRYYRTAEVLSTGIEMLPSYEIVMETGEVLIASSEHAWLAGGVDNTGHKKVYRWVKTKDLLTEYSYRLGLPKLAPVYEPERTYEAGFLAGAFDGEGSISKEKGGIRFAQRDNALMSQVQYYLKKGGYEYSIYNRKADDCLQLYVGGGLQNLMKFMMQCRPPRLLEKWSSQNLVASVYNMDRIPIRSVRSIGEYPCVTLTTSTGTYIAEGFPAHNTYKTVGFYWTKINRKSPGYFMGQGYYTRANCEQCLLATRGTPKRKSRGVRKLIVSPRREHSRKPDETHERIETLFRGPYLELFGRALRPGWDTFGNEAEKFETKYPTGEYHDQAED